MHERVTEKTEREERERDENEREIESSEKREKRRGIRMDRQGIAPCTNTHTESTQSYRSVERCVEPPLLMRWCDEAGNWA